MRNLRLLIVILTLSIISPVIFSTNVIAGTEDAEMGDVELTATPHRQGVGGEITIEVLIPFYGGCCYPLFAYDIKATLNIPQNVELVKGPITQKVDELEAEEGGAPTIVQFKWVIKSYSPGSYIINANVTTKNCGNIIPETTFEVVEGCSMSIPEVYPDIPNTEKDTIVMLEVSSGLENIEVERVYLYYVESSDEMPHETKELSAENDTLTWSDGNKKGKYIEMEVQKHATQTWKGVIPNQNKEETIYYWVVATDNTGKNTTGIVYSFEIFEMDRIYFVVDILNWVPIIGTIIGIVVIVFLFRKFHTTTTGKGVFLLGSDSSKDVHGTEIDTFRLNKLNLNRLVIALILLITSIIILIWAVYSGDFEEFTRLNGGI